MLALYPKASAISLPPWLLQLLPAGAVAGWGLHPLESAAFHGAQRRRYKRWCGVDRGASEGACRAWPRCGLGCLSDQLALRLEPELDRFSSRYCREDFCDL